MYSKTLVLILGLVVLVGCSSTKNEANKTDKILEDISDVRITLQRTPCYGTCPVYTVTITGNGDVSFIGTKFVYKEGEMRKKISVDSVRTLVNLFRSNEFFSLKDTYDNRAMSDAPTIIVTYSSTKSKKVVQHYTGDMSAPESLKTLENAIDRISTIREWVETDQQ